MGRNAKKTPRSQAAAAAPEPDAEASVAPASEVPEATAEATEEQPGVGDLGGDSGAAAATSPEPAADEPAADEPAAEDARWRETTGSSKPGPSFVKPAITGEELIAECKSG